MIARPGSYVNARGRRRALMPVLSFVLAATLALVPGPAQAGEVSGVRPATPAAVPATPVAVPDTGRVIVRFRPASKLLAIAGDKAADVTKARAKALGARLGLALDGGAPVAPDTQVVVAKAQDAAALAARLAVEADVQWAVPDRRRHVAAGPDDPLYAAGVPGNGPAVGQWYLRAPKADVKSSIDVETAWNVTRGDPAVVVAVLDTGVRFEHPDLLAAAAGGKLLPGYDMIADEDAGNDGDGRDADASDPGDWVSATEANASGGPFYQCTVQDPVTRRFVAQNSSWHGTQVASVIAALTDNGLGMAGVAPNLKVLPVRVLGKCGGFDSDIIAGMRWAAGLPVPGVPQNPDPARVLNLSLGDDGACPFAYNDAIAQITAAGAVIVASAGNSAGHAVGAPASCAGVVAVAGLRHVGTKVGFSNLGPNVTIAAPGGNCVNTAAGSACLYPILTAANAGSTAPAASIWTDSFNPSLGTSFSSPLVAGTAALMLSAQPGLLPAQVIALLRSSARPFPVTGGDNGDGSVVPACTAPQFDAAGKPVDQLQCYCTTATCGAGMLDAGAAVVAAKSGADARAAIEFYRADRDHYFITTNRDEIAKLDAGTIVGWDRTGQAFSAFASARAGTQPVCRFYLPPAAGDSHYFTASPDECRAVRNKFPQFVFETPEAFDIALPDIGTGLCPGGTRPVYRLWNQRADSNHRYTTSLVIRAGLIAKGYVAEGYGPDAVAMCAPE